MRLFVFVLLLLFTFPSFCNFLTDSTAAFRSSKKAKKPILIDFYGIWCPPCSELDETVFETPQFHEKSKNFVLLRVDVDAPKTWKLKDRYKIGGYPTIIFANPKGEEIYRLVGYRPLAEFIKAMDIAIAAKGKNANEACKLTDPESVYRCGIVCREQQDDACAEKAFRTLEGKFSPQSAQTLLIRDYFVEKSANEDLKRTAFERLLSEFSNTPIAMQWALSYLELFDSKVSKLSPKKELIEKVLEQYPTSSSSPLMDPLGFTQTDMAQMRAMLLSRLNRSDEAKRVWSEAANSYAALFQKLPKGSAGRGYTIERIYCLQQAGDIAGALKLTDDYRGRYPEEFTFHYLAASVLQDAKRYSDAFPIAQKAYLYSYGDNRIRAGTLLIKLAGVLENREEAKKIYEEVKGEFSPDRKLAIRTHRYLKQLDDAFKTK